MRTFDLTPFYRSTVGFDRLFSLLDQSASESSPGYPPYNIERTGENNFRISVAVSGFSQNEISIVAKENTLTIKGENAANENSQSSEVRPPLLTLNEGVSVHSHSLFQCHTNIRSDQSLSRVRLFATP